MLKLKDKTTNITGLKPEMFFALGIADRAFADDSLECVITAGLDGIHNTGSLHYLGLAVDLRNQSLTVEQHQRILTKLQRLERYGFDVVDEQPGQTVATTAMHFHVEYNPKVNEKFWRYEGE